MDSHSDNTQLMQALNFTAEDLELNKAGQLSDAQKKIMADKFTAGMKTMKMAMLGVIVLGIIMMFQEGEDMFAKFGVLNTFLIFIGIAVAFYVPMFFYIKRKNEQILEGKVKVEEVSGQVELSAKEVDRKSEAGFVMNFAGGQMVSCLIKINGKKIYTEEKVYQAFENAQRYNIYYITQTRGAYMIISAEKI